MAGMRSALGRNFRWMRGASARCPWSSPARWRRRAPC